MTVITIELPQDLAERASQAGLLRSPALAELFAGAATGAGITAYLWSIQDFVLIFETMG